MMSSNLLGSLWEHKVQNGTLVVGGVAAGTPAEQITSALGTWTETHGIGVLSFVEIFQIIGAFGILIASVNVLVNWYRAYRKRNDQ